MGEVFRHPIDNIQWVDVDTLKANDYNPNVVYTPELKLLKLSILQNGWIQPILASQNNVVIDGFHRWKLAQTDKEVREFTGGRVPCAILELTEAERMVLTIRINRAKGSHIAVKLHDIALKLVEEHGMSQGEIAKQIGATKQEVDLLLMDGVFQKLDIPNHKYSKAWYPR